MSFKFTISIWLSIYLIIAEVLVILVVVSALILIIVAAIYKKSNIDSLTRVFLLLYNN